MLDRATVERIAQEYYGIEYDEPLFSDKFREPILARGYLKKDELVEIARWKAPRAAGYAERNDDKTVRLVTRCAFACPEPCLANYVLQYLHGVATRMASAILTVYKPDEYTVMDVRAWASLTRLGLEKLGLEPSMDLNSSETYGAYLAACKRLADELGVDLRTLDRCLWALNGRTPEELPG